MNVRRRNAGSTPATATFTPRFPVTAATLAAAFAASGHFATAAARRSATTASPAPSRIACTTDKNRGNAASPTGSPGAGSFNTTDAKYGLSGAARSAASNTLCASTLAGS